VPQFVLIQEVKHEVLVKAHIICICCA
jgi:hypothetical protein